MPIDAIAGAGVAGPDWSIAMPDDMGIQDLGADAVGGIDGAQAAGESGGFGSMLSDQLGALQDLQTNAAAQSQALATGQAEDASQVVMAVEKAQLSMQLAATLRDKSVDAFQEVFRTQV
jgi:flagellar hook-basal body complex protein FliE